LELVVLELLVKVLLVELAFLMTLLIEMAVVVAAQVL
jgi:hypothetical protein